jgi:flagellar hook protein FlgE
MPSFGMFSSSIAALNGHSTSLAAIGDNIANVTSDGYKPKDILFAELVNGKARSESQTFNGMAPIARTLIDKQGEILNTGRSLDAGIIGSGFFVVNSQLAGSGETLLTRAGSFQPRAESNGQVFLADRDGNFLQGWPANNSGGFTITPSIASLGPIRIDPGSATFAPVASTLASLRANLNSTDPAGSVLNTNIDIFDSTGATNNVNLAFTKNAVPNTWDLVVSSPDGAVTTGTPATVTFDASGALIAPANQSVSITWTNPAAGASTIAIDLSNISQFGGPSVQQASSSNGNPSGSLTNVSINDNGEIDGQFSNGRTRAIYKLPIATVRNTAALEERSGTHFALGQDTGIVTLLEADQSAIAGLVGGGLENSSVQLSDEFTKMIVTQQAYNNAAQALRTVDEMFQIATTMKT